MDTRNKTIAKLTLLVIVVVGIFAVGSYDARNELSVLKPNAAVATFETTLSVPSFTTPTLGGTPTLDTPTLETPELDTPTLDTPELDTPELDVPELDVPELDTPELDVPELDTPELDVPELDTPELDVPELDVPELDVPDLDVPDLDAPDIDGPDYGFKYCSIYAATYSIFTGDDITLYWNTEGFDEIRINGELVTDNGSKTFENILVQTTYTLTATTDDGKFNCTKSITVNCIPPTPILTCSDYGFDFNVAKFEWIGSNYDPEYVRSGYSVNVTGNTTDAKWVSSPDVAGVIAKAGTSYKEYGGGSSGTVLKSQIGTGYNAISHVIFCGNIPVVTPSCELLPEFQTVAKGESATLSWDTENANSVSITDFGTVALSALNQPTDPLFVDTTFVLTASGYGKEVQCEAVVYVEEEVIIPTCDSFVAAPTTIIKGNSSLLSWETSNATEVTINNGIGAVSADDSILVSPAADISYILTAYGANSTKDQCIVHITVIDDYDTVPECKSFTADKTSLPVGGGDIEFNWEVLRANNITISPTIGSVSAVGSTTLNIVADTVFTLTAKDADGDEDSCVVAIDVEEYENTVPQCVSFTSDKTSLPFGGGTVQFEWSTLNAETVTINPLLGSVSKNGSGEATITNDITFTLTAKDADGEEDSCVVTIDVRDKENTIPQCLSFTADKTSLPVGGGNILLNWNTVRATDVVISPFPGSVSSIGTSSVNIVEDTILTLTATDDDGEKDTCILNIEVDEDVPTPISCSANVNFKANDIIVSENEEITLTWSTTGGINNVSINNGITSTALSGSESIRISNDTTFTLTATDGTDTVSCPLSIEVENGGGGGGGSSSPRCELDISDANIRRGERIELTWDTTRATEVRLFDDHGEVYVDTDEYLSRDKEDFYDGDITLRPTKDTEYTLLAERGRRDRECTVRVNVEDDITIIERRDLQPLVAGISLTQVPYTGFEAGPILTLLFYILLGAWALFVTYILVVRKESIAGFTLTPKGPASKQMTERERAPELFVDESPAQQESTVVASVPANLPTGDMPFVGYAAAAAGVSEVTDIEDIAHENHVLLSSDAISHFMTLHNDPTTRLTHLKEIIELSKSSYPMEEGWSVINLERMKALCATAHAPLLYESDNTPVSVPTGSGSLAEAIVTGNVVGAYTLIGNRPMVSLADAATDLDNLLRMKQGHVVAVSELLNSSTTGADIEKIKEAITALTGALDGTYNTEEEAVKMAIMKAIKAMA